MINFYTLYYNKLNKFRRMLEIYRYKYAIGNTERFCYFLKKDD